MSAKPKKNMWLIFFSRDGSIPTPIMVTGNIKKAYDVAISLDAIESLIPGYEPNQTYKTTVRHLKHGRPAVEIWNRAKFSSWDEARLKHYMQIRYIKQI
jgi:hypothetical protein